MAKLNRVAKKWIARLRSGKVKQAHDQLGTPEPAGRKETKNAKPDAKFVDDGFSGVVYGR